MGNVFHIELETIGVDTNEQIIRKGINIYKEKIEKFRKNIIDNVTKNVELIVPETLQTNYIDVLINGETHTLGNLLQSYLFKNHLNKELKYVGYKVPHPLEVKMILRVELNKEIESVEKR